MYSELSMLQRIREQERDDKFRSAIERRYRARQGDVEIQTYTIMVASRGMMGESSSVVKRSSGLAVYSIGLTVSKVGLLGLAGKYCRSMLAMMLEQLVNGTRHRIVCNLRRPERFISIITLGPHVMIIPRVPVENTRHCLDGVLAYQTICSCSCGATGPRGRVRGDIPLARTPSHTASSSPRSPVNPESQLN